MAEKAGYAPGFNLAEILIVHGLVMKMTKLARELMRIFAPHRPIEYVLKPVTTLAVFLIAYVGAEIALIGWQPDFLPQRLLAISMIQVPFLFIAFSVLIYLDGLQMELAGLAMTDMLTSLPNRRAFIEHVTDVQQSGDVGFLLIIDADHFKKINDTYGHAVGDVCLKAIARRLECSKAAEDVIGRIGGEEFGAYMPYSTSDNIVQVGRRMCREILVETDDPDSPVCFTLSVGATETRPKEPVEIALARADEALYVAKETGRAKLVQWSKAMSDAA